MSLSAEFYVLDAIRNLEDVSIPGLGTFRRKYNPASLDPVQQILTAPLETPEFTPDVHSKGLKNFSRFLQSGNTIASSGSLLHEIESEIKRIIDNNGSFTIQTIGKIHFNNGIAEISWHEDAQQKIFSNLYGFKDIQLSPKELVSKHPAKTEPLPVASKQVEPEPVISTPVETHVPVEPTTVQGITQEEGPAQKALKKKSTTSGKKRRFPVVLILLLLILLATPIAVYYMYPDLFSSQKVETLPPPIVVQQEPEPEPEPEKVSVPEPIVAGYYLIIVSTQSESEAQGAAERWAQQGYDTKIVPPNDESVYYRVSILHSTQRSELVNEMIKLKDVTYSWILESR
jgi:hypothetical protein